MNLEQRRIAIIGLGYVGLPLAIEFAKYFPVIGFDINAERVNELNKGIDRTLEADLTKLNYVLELGTKDEFKIGLKCISDPRQLSTADIFIVTVPTPIDRYNSPDLLPLHSATRILGGIIKINDIVIYESTVYPGCTEEECVPILEEVSKLKYNNDFFVGYSPERINPGDKVHTLTSVKKVTSGSTVEVAELIDSLYRKIIAAGTHLAPSIKVAEASKAIENAQRDVNISFVNELSLIFDRVGIDTNDVLDAAGTKYNFLKYKPGLVGGHCISVDPYYLAHKATQLGYHPQVILSGRRVNDMMAGFVANKVVKLMINSGQTIRYNKVLILGITFKENCPDIRNTKVVDIYHELEQFGLVVDIFDPYADQEEVYHEYGVEMISDYNNVEDYGAIIVAVAHDEFLEFNFRQFKEKGAVIFDAKGFLDRKVVDGRL